MSQTHHQLVECPTYTGSILIFPWNQTTKKFGRDFYIPLMTNYKITFEHIDLFLNEADTIACKRNTKIKILYSIYFTMIAIVTLFILTALFALGESAVFNAGSLLIWVFISMIFGIHISKCAQKRIDSAHAEMEIIKQNFIPYFEEMGFEWLYVKTYPGWMELSKIKKADNPEDEGAKSKTFVLDQDRQTGLDQ